MRELLLGWEYFSARPVGSFGLHHRCYWWLLLLLSQAIPTAAQVAVSGTVRDSLTRQPLPFASVFLTNTTYGTTTDAQGYYRLTGMPNGPYALTASYLGYAIRQPPVVLSSEPLVVELLLPAAT